MAVAVVSKGHTEHTKEADSQIGLRGEMPRPIKIVFLGAGSGFTPHLLNDVLSIPGAAAGEFVIVDIDETRLGIMHKVVQKLIEKTGKGEGWKISASTDRRQALPGADYIVNCIEVSGIHCVRFDNDIPAKYGVDQCIGDTIGPGGLFKALRTVPVFLEILRDAEKLCPRALVLNYTNPMNIMCLAAGRTTSMQLVGLCHSVQGTSHLLAKRAGIAVEEMEWECAGINHLAWFTKLRHRGQDLYPILMEKARQDLSGNPSDPEDKDLVRKDMMLHFGAFITESSGHLSEYLPYYRKRKDLHPKYLRERYDGGSSFYANEWPGWRKSADEHRQKVIRGEAEIGGKRSWEYASWIIEAREKDSPFRIHGNVMNVHPRNGAGPLISNLMGDGCVEVACMIDRNGINPTACGKLPAQMAAICDWNMRMFD
ncbi:MAG TPA: hypothetical protein VIL86_15300, partial [Tepidisphaeraceae bacterium]